MIITAASFLACSVEPEPPVIVVTGRGLDQLPADSVYGVVTIDQARLATSPSNRLDAILREVPGFQLFRRSDARSANPTSQGPTLRGLGGNAASRVQVTLDGVPQADPFGGWISWPALDPRRLGEVRIVRGGGSGAAGAGALAGAIELDSATDASLGAALALGSRNSADAFARAGLALGGGNLTLSASRATGDGFIPVVAGQRGPVDRPAPYHQGSVTVRAVAPLTGAVELQASLLALKDERERGTAFSQIRTDGVDASLRLVGSGRWAWSALAYLQTRSFFNAFASVNADRSAVAPVSEQYEVPSTGRGARLEVRPPLGRLTLRLGADVRALDGETRERFAFQAGAATRGRRAGGETLTSGLFVEAAWRQGPLLFTAGGRIDHWRLTGGRLREELFATGAVLTDRAFADRSGWEPTARGGVAWRISDTVTTRAAAYLGWRLPTLNELYRPFRAGADATAANEELAPERLAGAEAGLDWRPFDGARIGVAAFVNRLEDAIANVTLGTGPGTFPGVGFVAAGGSFRRRDNLAAVVSRGIEADASLTRGPWSLTLGYSFVDPRISATGAATSLDGLRPAQTPRHSGSATLAWADGRGGEATAGIRYAGPQFEDDLNRQRLPAALTLETAARWPIGYGLAIEARGENLTDERVVAAISGDGLIERGTPRTLWLGLSLRR